MSRHSEAAKKVCNGRQKCFCYGLHYTDMLTLLLLTGYLYLLSTGILFAFKKPLLFFSFDTVVSVSYTSVLQRTFNLNVMARPSNGSEEDEQEFEFSMIDQADYSGIHAYVKRHGLQDASLAEARRAKVYNVNGGKAEDPAVAAESTAGGAEESELQKAERELEDQEDEEEEDYDPGSDGDSDGSGSSSEEEDGDEFHEDADQVSDGDDDDLLKRELGSEAEDFPEEEY